MKPRPIQSLDEFYHLIDKAPIQVGILLNPVVRSTHVFSRKGKKILDYSHVDDSKTRYSAEEFETTIYAQAIPRKAMILEEVYQ